MTEPHHFVPGMVYDMMPPVTVCAVCQRVESSLEHISEPPAWKTIEAPDGPWILVLPERISRGDYLNEIAVEVVHHFKANPPLIVFARHLDDIKALDEDQMRDLGWVRA